MAEKVQEKIALVKKTLHYFSVKGLSSNELEEQSIEIGEDHYDASGRLVQRTQSLWPAQGTESETWSFNENGQLERYVHIIADADLPEDHRYRYNDEGKIAEEELLYADGTKDRITYHYNDQHQLVRKEIRDYEGENAGEEVFIYNGENLVSHQKTDDEGEVSDRADFVYDDTGILIEKHESSMYETQLIHFKLSYDTRNRVVREEREENGMLFIIHKLYSGKHLDKVVTEDAEGNRIREIIYQYDEDGHVVEEQESVYQADAMVSEQHFRRTYQYTFH